MDLQNKNLIRIWAFLASELLNEKCKKRISEDEKEIFEIIDFRGTPTRISPLIIIKACYRQIIACLNEKLWEIKYLHSIPVSWGID